MNRHPLLERLDQAAAIYRRSFAEAPGESFAYVRPGDDYTLGDLPPHVNSVLLRYLAVAEAIVAADFGEVTATEPSPPAPDARAALAETPALHERVREVLAGVDPDDMARTAPVVYGEGDPYPTSLSDLAGWLIDHYLEHATQANALLADWRTLAAVESFNRAFARHDVGAVMAAMTEDCVFENTSPAPDGERLVGAERVAAFWRRFFDSTPSAVFEVEEAFATGDRSVVRWVFSWDEGPENHGHVRGVDVFRVRDGRVAEKLSYVKG